MISRMHIAELTISPRLAGCAALLLLVTHGSAVHGTDALDRSLQLGGENHRHEQQTQRRIEELDDRTRAMLEEYQRLGREQEALLSYNDQLERIVRSQEAETASLNTQLEDIDLTRREIMPLMLRMVESLEDFVALDPTAAAWLASSSPRERA